MTDHDPNKEMLTLAAAALGALLPALVKAFSAAQPAQETTMSWYYNGIAYSRHDLIPLVEMLLSDPDAQAKFRTALIESITGLMDWGDYRSARETFDVMCAVLIQVDKAIGRPVLE